MNLKSTARVRIGWFSSYLPTKSQIAFFRLGLVELLKIQDECLELSVNSSGKFDLVLVTNYSPTISFARVPTNMIIKVVQEPVVVGNLSRRSSSRHSSIFSQVITHTESDLGEKTVTRQPGLLPSDGIELFSPDVLLKSKAKMVSTVTSTISDLPGHVERNRVVSELCASREFGIDCFGRGRLELLSKADGLIPYRYSIAIENSRSGLYTTEKLTDCFLTMTVPIYFGSLDAEKDWPAGSFIRIDSLQLDAINDALARVSAEDYLARVPLLKEARKAALLKHSLAGIVADRLKEEPPEKDSWLRVWNSDTLLMGFLKLASPVISLLSKGKKRIKMFSKQPAKFRSEP